MNPIQIIIAAAVGFVIGGLWFGPLFGKTWMRLQGITEKDMAKFKKDPKKMAGLKRSYALTFLAQFVMAGVLAFIIDRLVITSWAQGAFIGFLVGIGFVATTALNRVLFENRSWASYGFDLAYYLVALTIMGAILAF